MSKRFLLVAGNIGSGKTSLTERIGARLDWHTGFESVADNPYLPDFYQDMRQWSFHLQVFFLGHRARQHRTLAEHPLSAISDRSIYEDAFIFARALHHLGNLSERDLQAYQAVFDLVSEGLPRPDLLLYLKAPVPVLMERIQRRHRPKRRRHSRAHLALLDLFYEEWMQNFDLCPVLTIHTSDLDFVHKPHHLDTVIDRIQQKLAGREDVYLKG